MPYAKNRRAPSLTDPMKGYSNGAGHLAAAIVEKAVHDWRAAGVYDYYESVCGGDELLGFERCPYFLKCYSSKGCSTRRGGSRYHRCTKRTELLRAELERFFESGWFELLCGDVDPDVIRQEILSRGTACRARTEERDDKCA